MGLLGVGSGRVRIRVTRRPMFPGFFSGNSTRGTIETVSFGGGKKLEFSSPGVGSLG
jgi:hypothetical protein